MATITGIAAGLRNTGVGLVPYSRAGRPNDKTQGSPL